ncbi:hypothetical protein ADUPG1_007389 [Aduncisulcus paluster]|uniref:Uncharacterized protein n=1 Tax=Aduncisulcus paluster TaxID=2918883 RepID=A0ABQ5KPP8_9EUKA|nr:hypothetical protein ADUPG1_007389 [Aduncisulcus paluster]
MQFPLDEPFVEFTSTEESVAERVERLERENREHKLRISELEEQLADQYSLDSERSLMDGLEGLLLAKTSPTKEKNPEKPKKKDLSAKNAILHRKLFKLRSEVKLLQQKNRNLQKKLKHLQAQRVDEMQAREVQMECSVNDIIRSSYSPSSLDTFRPASLSVFHLRTADEKREEAFRERRESEDRGFTSVIPTSPDFLPQSLPVHTHVSSIHERSAIAVGSRCSHKKQRHRGSVSDASLSGLSLGRSVHSSIVNQLLADAEREADEGEERERDFDGFEL